MFSMLCDFICCIDVNTLLAIFMLVISIATCAIAYYTYLPIKGHKFSVLEMLYLNVLPGYIKEIILFNLKNKTEVICKLYAKLKDGTYVTLDADIEGKLSAKKIGARNPIIIEPYQSKKIYIREASYFKQRSMKKGAPLFNCVDIHNKLDGYYIVLSDGTKLKIDGLNVEKIVNKFEDSNIVIDRCVCKGQAKIKNKILSNFSVYNKFECIIVHSDNQDFPLNVGKNYTKNSIEKAIRQQMKLPKNCTIQLDKDIDDFLSTLKQKEFPKIGILQRLRNKITN